MVRTSSFVSLVLASLPTIALAQGEAGAPVAEPAPDPAATTVTAPAPPPPPPAATGTRMRNGFSLSAGTEFGSSGIGENFSGQLFGLDWRIGAQVTDKIGVYASTHMSFGTGEFMGGGSGFTGNFAFAVIGEYTLPKRVFVGGGAGYGIVNNPSGLMPQLRAGWYPFETTGTAKKRRLNVALDARFYMLEEAYGRITQLALTLGYDRF